jgi:hypothetical protein
MVIPSLPEISLVMPQFCSANTGGSQFHRSALDWLIVRKSAVGHPPDLRTHQWEDIWRAERCPPRPANPKAGIYAGNTV